MRSAHWLLAAAASFSLAAAQSVTSAPSGSATGTAQRTTTGASSRSSATGSQPPQTYTVQVGVQHQFRPDQIVAAPGDLIKFEFHPVNHSVVKADFGDPCVPYEYHYRDGPTFFSGNKLSQVDEQKPTWELRVNDTNPVFFYCAAPESCFKWKMIGVINPNNTWSLENQLKFHANSTRFQLSPGEPYPDESAPRPSTTGGAQQTSGPSDPGSSGGGGLSGGAIAGIAIGGAAVLIIAAALVWFCGRRGGIEKGYRKSTVVQPSSAPMVEAQYGPSDKGPGSSTHYASGVPSHHDPYRAASPSSWSNSQPLSSPHQSYLGHNGSSPGYPPYNTHSPLMTGQEVQHTGSTSFYDVYGNEITKAPEAPPVELPGQDTLHPQELAANPYTGSAVQSPTHPTGQHLQTQYADHTQQAYSDQHQAPYTDHAQHPNQQHR